MFPQRASVGNYVRFRLGPQVAIAVGALIKAPGERLEGKPVELSVVRQDTADDMDAYERLLGDAMHGDATLFARQDVVETAWAIVDPLIDASRRRSSTRPAAGAGRRPIVWWPRRRRMEYTGCVRTGAYTDARCASWLLSLAALVLAQPPGPRITVTFPAARAPRP